MPKISMIDADKLRQQFSEDIKSFAIGCFPKAVTKLPFAPFHEEFFQEASKFNGGVRRVYAWPRGTGKSTLIYHVAVPWLLLTGRKQFIVTVSRTEIQNNLHFTTIKDDFETNDVLKAVYGNVQGEKWGTKGIEIKNYGFILPRMIGKSTRGYIYKHIRPGLMIIDDPEEDSDLDSEKILQRNREWMDSAIERLGEFSDSLDVAMLCTLLGEKCLGSYLINKRGWESRIWGIEDKNGNPTWPAGYPAKEILADKKHMTKVAFAREMMNDYKMAGATLFDRERIRYYDPAKILVDDLTIRVCIDPALRDKKYSDYCGIVTLGSTDWGKVYVLDAQRQHVSLGNLAPLLADILRIWRPAYIICENHVGESLLTPILKQAQILAEHRCMVKLVSHNIPKPIRIGAIACPIEIGQIAFCTEQTDLLDEVKGYPAVANDDLIDALALGFTDSNEFIIYDPEDAEDDIVDVSLSANGDNFQKPITTFRVENRNKYLFKRGGDMRLLNRQCHGVQYAR